MSHGYESSARPASDLAPPPRGPAPGGDVRKEAPALLDRAERMLATYDRRGNTNVAGTYSLIRDLAAVVRNRGELEAIVRDLDIDTEPWAVSCPWNCSGEADGSGHDTGCPWRRLRAWVSAHPVSGDQPDDPWTDDERAALMAMQMRTDAFRNADGPVSGDQQ